MLYAAPNAEVRYANPASRASSRRVALLLWHPWASGVSHIYNLGILVRCRFIIWVDAALKAQTLFGCTLYTYDCASHHPYTPSTHAIVHAIVLGSRWQARGTAKKMSICIVNWHRQIGKKGLHPVRRKAYLNLRTREG